MDNQELLEKVYLESTNGIREEWFSNDSTNWYDFIDNLESRLQITYTIVVFHNQVFNGGFHQYFVNGYGQFSNKTINALTKIGARKKAKLLERALAMVNFENMNEIDFRKKLLNSEISILFQSDELFEPLDELDNKYYEIEDEDIENLLGDYLLQH